MLRRFHTSKPRGRSTTNTTAGSQGRPIRKATREVYDNARANDHLFPCFALHNTARIYALPLGAERDPILTL